MKTLVIHWFRRDLRLDDNVSLSVAANKGELLLPLFIFDDDILGELPKNDPRVNFIHEQLLRISENLSKCAGGVLVKKGKVLEVWKSIIDDLKKEGYKRIEVHANKDFEPYGIARDEKVAALFSQHQISFIKHKDHVIFEPGEVTKDDGNPYTVYTPYKKKWLSSLREEHLINHLFDKEKLTFYEVTGLPSLEELGFVASSIKVLPYKEISAEIYCKTRDIPNADSTSYLGPHLRFGTVSIRQLVRKYQHEEGTFLSELIWRSFFIQILYFFPKVVDGNFRSKYDGIRWENNPEQFRRWCEGTTGYPIVDAGMRQLNRTGYMHNRVRMIVASFLCKHLLIDWRWGEAYFAKKLLDFELASNNGNWQWAAGTGCDAAPYFRVFNPSTQTEKFDGEGKYIREWVTDLDELSYPQPIVEHKSARVRAIERYKKGIS